MRLIAKKVVPPHCIWEEILQSKLLLRLCLKQDTKKKKKKDDRKTITRIMIRRFLYHRTLYTFIPFLAMIVIIRIGTLMMIIDLVPFEAISQRPHHHRRRYLIQLQYQAFEVALQVKEQLLRSPSKTHYSLPPTLLPPAATITIAITIMKTNQKWK